MSFASFPRAFSNLAWSNLAAQAAEQLSLAAAPLTAVLLLSAGPGEVGILTAFQTLPFLLLALPLGVLADRVPRRKIMLAGELLRLASLAALVWLVAGGGLTIAHLSVLGFFGAVGTVAFSVAAPGLVASLVAKDDLAAANARIELARSTAFAAGPALAGALVSWMGASTVFVLAAGLSALAVALLLRVSTVFVARHGGRRHIVHEVMEGAAFVSRSPLLRPIMVTGVIFNLAWFALQAGYVPYAIRHLHLSASAVGTSLSFYGIGMFVGAAATSRIVKRIAFGRAILIGPLAGVLAISGLVITVFYPLQWLPAICFFLFGAGPMIWTITATTLRQNMTPGDMLGRVTALFLMANSGARPLGALLGGLAGARWGEAACVFVALAGFFLQAMVIVRSDVAVLARADDSAVALERCPE